MGTPRLIKGAGSWHAVKYSGVNIEKRLIGERSRSWTAPARRTAICVGEEEFEFAILVVKRQGPLRFAGPNEMNA